MMTVRNTQLPFLGYKQGHFYYYCDFSDNTLARRAGFGWSKEKRCWITPFADCARKLVKRENTQWAALMTRCMAQEQAAIDMSHARTSSLQIPAPLGLSYLPFQRAGVEYMLPRKNVLLADQMGLGKTIQVLGLVNLLHDRGEPLKHILIVCPATGKLNWGREWVKWCIPQYDTYIVRGTKDRCIANVIIVNYDILSHYRAELLGRVWDMVVYDECHYLKNREAIRTQLAFGSSDWKQRKAGDVGIRARIKIAVTGTPVKNRAIELFPSINHPLPTGWPRIADFDMQHCGGDGRGAHNLRLLQRRLRSTIMVRRLKKHVMPDLPKKQRQVIEFEGDTKTARSLTAERKLWTKVLRDAGVGDIDTLLTSEDCFKRVIRTLKGGGGVPFEEISRVRHETAVAKVPMVINYLQDAIESSGKVVCFVWHKDVASAVCEAFPGEHVKLVGGMSETQKYQSIDTFMEQDRIRLFVGNIIAAGTVINLTAASHAVFAELSWVPGDVTQAEDRLHRHGATAESILITHLVLAESMDAWMANVIVYKQGNIEQILDDPDYEEMPDVLS